MTDQYNGIGTGRQKVLQPLNTFNNDTWKKWFGPKEDEDKDKKKPEGDDEDSEGSEEDGTCLLYTSRCV